MYHGEAAAEQLIRQLYDGSMSEQDQATVLGLLDLGYEFTHARSAKRCEELRQQINAIMCRFKFYPAIVSRKQGVLWETHDDMSEFKSTGAAISLWLRLHTQRAVHRLRRCALPSCGRFHFSKTASRFCCLEHRQEADRNDVQRRKRRAEYARQYRARVAVRP